LPTSDFGKAYHQNVRRGLTIALLLSAGAGLAFAYGGAGWKSGAPMPEERSEVAAAVFRGGIAVVGGFLADGTSSSRVDLYLPGKNAWGRLPNLPVEVNHAMAASDGKRLFVVGGYGEGRQRLRHAFVLDGPRWRRLPQMPEPRTAGGAALVGNRLYVVGGIGAEGLAQTALVLDLVTRRWRRISGPTPREHLAVTTLGGAVYALAGRTGGFDTNLSTFETFQPRTGRWRPLPPVPEPRGGTGAAAAGGRIFSAGGEATEGTVASVYAYRIATGKWERLPDLPTPRHGLGVVAHGTRLYVLAGGREPGLHVSNVNEYLELG
jgi:non-specific serine/threonine protein kinase